MMSPRRPVFLDLARIRFPATAVASILHRISGLALVAAIPGALWLLQLSVSGAEGFSRARELLAAPWVLLWVWAAAHHLLAGIRVLLIDVEIGVDRTSARRSARAAIAGGVLLAVLLAVLGPWS